MDTEKHIEIEKKIREGMSPNDEGAYYHVGQWESYKSGVKGKFGGSVIGGIVGAVVGGVVVASLGLAGVILPGIAPILAIGLFMGVGIKKGYDEFSEIGHIVGSGAAQTRLLEARIRTMMDGKVAEVKEEIGDLKSVITGQPNEHKEELHQLQQIAKEDETHYRKAHYAKLNPVKFNSFAFWKVALIGLAAGAAIGLALSIGGAAGPAGMILGHILGEAAVEHMGLSGVALASAATFGALGASYGLNRDFFRKIFDKTDLLFKGIIDGRSHDRMREDQVEAGKEVEKKLNGHGKKPETVIPDYGYAIDYPSSDTHFRDKTLPAAQRALLSFDHTRATPQ